MTGPDEAWLLLLHQIPPKPSYFRAKVLRRLNQLGALAVKNSAYLLPENDETVEDLQWLLREVRSEGGEAWLFRCEMIAGETKDGIRDKFRALRAPDWLELAKPARELLDSLRAAGSQSNAAGPTEVNWENLRRRQAELQRIDFFGTPERVETEALMSEIEREMTQSKRSGPAGAQTDEGTLGTLRGRTWVTRTGVKVDRMASAWLIRRFIDPAARFDFVDSAASARPDDLRFDMFDGEFTHEGDRCTFEVLHDRSGLRDQALTEIGEIVHDIDFKDAKFGRPEAVGIASLIDGIVLGNRDDAKRLDEGARLFDALYSSKRREPDPEGPHQPTS